MTRSSQSSSPKSASELFQDEESEQQQELEAAALARSKRRTGTSRRRLEDFVGVRRRIQVPPEDATEASIVSSTTEGPFGPGKSDAGKEMTARQEFSLEVERSPMPQYEATDSVAYSEDDGASLQQHQHSQHHQQQHQRLDHNNYFYKDSTETVQEMYLALLYLLSNPEEFTKAVEHRGDLAVGTPRSTLAAWHAEYANTDEEDDGTFGDDDEYTNTDVGDNTADMAPPPLPYIVFAPDAEVVLPQAHTASQLFGLERSSGIELEAAAGVAAVSQLFLRWLALMPGGDHMNIIDPPALTVMRIAGGRYRVTGAHRVVWSWLNEFPPEIMGNMSLAPSSAAADLHPQEELHFGDLVTMTIVDVFETDGDGKLLSYCPTFDNRAVRRTTTAAERLKKGSSILKSHLNDVANSSTAVRVNRAAAMFTRMGIQAATSMTDTVKKKIDEELLKAKGTGAAITDKSSVAEGSEIKDAEAFEKALNAAEAAVPSRSSAETQQEGKDGAKQSQPPTEPHVASRRRQGRGEDYMSDDSTMVDEESAQI